MAAGVRRCLLWLATGCLLALGSASARASIAYGSINNFDTVNDTGVECHGFEIELEDVHSTDITYTYDWNHYGVPQIGEDNSVPAHPRVSVRWVSAKNATGGWAAYTAIPAGPIAPTDGHMFTDPTVNFGGEHFGLGYMVSPTAVRYYWLLDDGSGNLIRGPQVQVATPTFVYVPPAVVVPAQVQAAIVPPPPPAPPPLEFGDPLWVKEIRTSTHNHHEVPLRNLISEDPDNANDPNWRNGEPDEVEMEWQVLQTDYNAGAGGGANGELQGAPEDLPNGDEVVTRRYEFYKYLGPLDAETGEAMADVVAPDGIHGMGTKTVNGVETDLSVLVIVGDYIGSQMAAVDVDAPVGLIDHLQDGEVNVEYPPRTVVIPGNLPFTATTLGALPAGMSFDEVTGILSGTPTESGTFAFTVNATDASTPDKSKSYALAIAAAGVALPPRYSLDTSASPVDAGITTGDGLYDVGGPATAEALANPGFAFTQWTDNGTVVSTSPSYTFTMDINHSLVAHFVAGIMIATSAAPTAGGATSGGGTVDSGVSVTVSATQNPGYTFVNWTENGIPVAATLSYTFTATVSRALVANFVAAGPPGWSFTIHADNAAIHEVVLGLAPGATAGYDQGQDALAPPNPPMNTGNLYFLGTGNRRYQTEMHSSTLASDSWTLTVAAGALPVTLTWDSAAVPAGKSLIMQELDNQGQAVPGSLVDLALAQTRPAPVSANTAMSYRFTYGRFFDLDLHVGWNLISLPLEPHDSAVASLFYSPAHGPVNLGPASTFDGTQVVAAQVLHALQGAWIYITEPGVIRIYGFKPDVTTVSLGIGWHLVGPAATIPAPSSPSVHLPIWSWNGHGYATAATLTPGSGYWIYILAPYMLELE